jgi:hypothetical protein
MLVGSVAISYYGLGYFARQLESKLFGQIRALVPTSTRG